MKKGEVIILNGVFSNKIKLPVMTGEELYAILSAKADISKVAEEIEKKAESFKMGIKPEGVDEFTAKATDPKVIEWMEKYIPLQNRLYNEAFEGTLPHPCIPKGLFVSMCAGLTPGEAELIVKYLVIG